MEALEESPLVVVHRVVGVQVELLQGFELALN